LSGRGLCDELITRPEESYRLCCVVVCDLETSRMGAPYIYDISHLRVNVKGVFRFSLQLLSETFLILRINERYKIKNVYWSSWSSWSSCKAVIKCTLVQALRLCAGRTVHRGSRSIALLFLDHGTRRAEGSATRPGRFLPPGKTRYPLYRRVGGPQGHSGQVRKISPPPGFDPLTVQPVAIRYTDWAIRPAVFM